MDIEYLGTPFTHINREVVELRYNLITRAAGALILQQRIILSPITHCHPIAKLLTFPIDYKYWRHINRAYIRASKKFLILTLPGWLESKGLTAEREYASSLGIPLEKINPTDVGISEEMICNLISLQSESEN